MLLKLILRMQSIFSNAQAKSDQEVICNKIKSLSKHYSLVKMGDSDRPIFMRDRAFWELNK